MMGRGAPFDKRLDGMVTDDFDVPSSPDGGGGDIDDGAPAEEQFRDTAADEIMNQDGRISPTADKRRGDTNNNDSSDTNDGGYSAAQSLKEKLRPKRNPKGHRFRGWMHPKEFNFWDAQSQNKHDSDSSENSNNNNDSNDRAAWWRNNRLCFEIDYICHRPQSNTWAYMTSSKWKQTVFQPTMELKPSAWKYDAGRYNAELRVGIKVDSPTRRMEHEESGGEEFSFDTCQLSTTDTHVVLQSVFNDMVGEFYSRSLLGLYQTMVMGVQQDDDANSTDNDEAKSSQSLALPWEQDIQFYIHIPLRGKEVLDGHKLFTAGMLANSNAGMPMSFLDLFQPPENVEDDCQCYRKMVFCGYDVYTHDEQVNSEDIDTVEHYDKKKKEGDEEEDEMESNPGDDKVGSDEDEEDVERANSKKKTGTDLTVSDNSSPSFKTNLKYTLWSSGTVAKHKKDTINCNRRRGEKCQGYANLRSLMSSNFVKHYPSLNDDIIKFRREALLTKSLISDDYSGDTKEWLVVGLTQRTYRRAWLNLPTVMKQCNTKLNDRGVIFIEVNVEDTSSPYEQLILHRSLDVMIGVHGAQLTQAVVLPPHAHVLEILPWVPSYIRGNWVTRRDAPTPLGIIYHNTDLNHAGYSLDRSSTDLCVGVGEVGSEEEKDCFLGQRKIFIWDNRDFNVEPEVIIQYIEKLVLFMRDDEMGKLCAEVKDRLDERFVLYNIWCADEEEESILAVSHYYAEAGPTAEGEQYGMGRRKKLKMAKDE